MGDLIPGLYYKDDLVKSPPVDENHFFEVEKVIKTKTINRKKYFYVKFLYYPNKFNAWIEESNFKKT